MSSRAEHYIKAEEWLAEADPPIHGPYEADQPDPRAVEFAHVHALLANVAPEVEDEAMDS